MIEPFILFYAMVAGSVLASVEDSPAHKTLKALFWPVLLGMVIAEQTNDN